MLAWREDHQVGRGRPRFQHGLHNQQAAWQSELNIGTFRFLVPGEHGLEFRADREIFPDHLAGAVVENDLGSEFPFAGNLAE